MSNLPMKVCNSFSFGETVNAGLIEEVTQVKLNEGSSPSRNQILDLANLVLSGSKQTIGYGVRSTAERSTGSFYAGKGDAGLRFNSFLFSNIAD
jgi:hypothetical protein